MIASLRGAVLDVSLTGAVIETGGVGMSVQATPTTLSSLRVGREVLVHTELVVREDSLTLYAFIDADERDCFRVLMGVRGVGPRLALAMLAVHTPDALRKAVADQDVAALRRVPGLGPKGAQRVIIDVGDRLGPAAGEASGSGGGPHDQVAAVSGEPNPDVVAALVQLGWNEATAREAVSTVEAGEAGAATTVPGQAADVAALLRASLRWLGGARRG
ncbi:Holliday junction branch migration protein RuvA [Actinomyces sp. 2119]|uniref:Holliday junction branch migration complex subunit RuvA n=1 Tax=Actinomyces lilanjuaniae TaxID=2321394 RepID=A0ABN5PN48_9ACTO|nr:MULTISPECIES: Holliday junction branch migration protein RuvA [Actinomyces]AYD89742.1 Holliday junction branch migration protein RuvA [Actinomyces lilanjuaniae]RJF44709.1 Holliday junction branch migration protein RuvA [Actinomyces sp. 2119]